MPEAPTKLKTHRFDQMAVQVKDKVHPSEADVDRYVGLEHIDPESLKIRRWGEPGDVDSSKILFRSGDIIFGKRRAYQRKLAVADCDGICSAHAMVLRPKTDVVLKEFLPFFMQTDEFMERAVKISVGGLSPTINWKALAREKFVLPRLREQERIAQALCSASATADQLALLLAAAETCLRSLSFSLLSTTERHKLKPSQWLRHGWRIATLASLVQEDAPICYGIVQVGQDDPSGVPTLAIHNLRGDYVSGVHRTSPRIESGYGRSRVSPGDVLISIKGTIGEVAVVPEGFNGNISRDVARIRLSPEHIESAFFRHLYRSPSYARYVSSLIVGTTRAELSIDTLRRMEVPIPQLEEQRRIAARLDAADACITQLRSKLRQARKLQSTLRESMIFPEGGE